MARPPTQHPVDRPGPDPARPGPDSGAWPGPVSGAWRGPDPGARFGPVSGARLGPARPPDRRRPTRDVLATEFETFVRTRGHSLLRSAYLLTGDQHLAEDLVQSALARVYRVWPRLDERGNAEAYVRKAMYHIQVSWWRRRRPAESLGIDGAAGTRATEPAGDSGLADRLTLRQALTRLTSRQRAVLVLRFYEDRSEAETAELLGVGTGTVKSQTAKALARLRTVAPELAELYFPKGGTR